MAARAQARLVVLCAFALLLAGCGPTPGPVPDDSPPSSTPTPSAPAVTVLDADVLLAISAVATAPDGSTLELSMQVHRALAWNDPEAASLAALMTSGCEGSLDAGVYEANLWSFLEIDINAMQVSSTTEWPSGSITSIVPVPSNELTLASSGAILEADNGNPATPHCLRARYLDAPGESLLVAGLQGDTDEVGAAGQFRRWANHSYGFQSGTAVVLSDCSFLLTDAGKKLGGGAAWWTSTVDGTSCVIGGTP